MLLLRQNSFLSPVPQRKNLGSKAPIKPGPLGLKWIKTKRSLPEKELEGISPSLSKRNPAFSAPRTNARAFLGICGMCVCECAHSHVNLWHWSVPIPVPPTCFPVLHLQIAWDILRRLLFRYLPGMKIGIKIKILEI